ncbi:MAG: M20 family metallopeptidase [Sedimentisphaerales bacterium]|nr:M20 family metallopeptidase [Sedimentisphaerales bacterium]
MKELLRTLIQAQTTADTGELAAAEIISAEFARCGIDSKIDVWETNRANVIVRIGSTGQKPALLFACHHDVVGPGEAEWQYPPFEAVEVDGKIYGRGATDMKGGIAAAITAICRIVNSGTKLLGDIIFVAAAGEETDSIGAERFVKGCDRLPELVGVLIPEPTDFSIVTAHRGMLWLEVTTKGKSAHGSAPQLGVNAITSMRQFLNELDKYDITAKSHELLGNCSMSVNTISGGKTLNVVPDKCSVGIDIRTVPGVEHQDIFADIERILEKLKSENSQFEAEVSVVRQVQSMETQRDCDFVRELCSSLGTDQTHAVGFTTDGPHFASLGVPVVIFGPGKPHLCHKPDEYIEIADLEEAVEYYQKIIVHLLT